MRVFVLLLFGLVGHGVVAATPTAGEINTWAASLSTRLSALADEELCHGSFQVRCLLCFFLFLFCSFFFFVEEKLIGDFPSQSTLTSLVANNVTIDGRALTADVAARLVARFQRATLSATNIRDKVQRLASGVDLSPGRDSSQECCQLSLASNPIDWQFQTMTDRTKSCKRYPQGVSASTSSVAAFEAWSAGLDSVFSSELQEAPVAWTYFGHSSGAYKIFPGATSSSCGSYDPRYRPWWLAAQTEAKRVVIIIDKSGSMGSNGRMARARDAAMAVLDTLNPNDWFAVFAFDSIVSTQSACFPVPCCMGNELAIATPYNIQEAQRWVQTIQDGGGTHYGNAFTKALAMLSASDSRASVLKTAILFLTDGAPQDSNYRSLVQTSPSTYRWFIFGLGIDDSSAVTILNGLASDGRTGQATIVPDGGNLRSSMASYYENPYFLVANVGQCITTVPYFDFSGLGLVLTVACPAHQQSNNQLIGVVGVDVPFARLVEDLTAVTSLNGWAILIDAAQRTLVHPRLTSPSNVETDPNFVSITDLESNAVFRDVVLPSMLSYSTGSVTTTIVQVISRGNSGEEGSETRSLEVTYYWQPLNGTGLFLAIAIPTESKIQKFYVAPVNTNHVYHRIDLDPQGQKVGADGRRGGFLTNAGDANAFPGVKLAPFAYRDQYLYVNRPETVQNVTEFLAWSRQPYSPAALLANQRYSNAEKLHRDLAALGLIDACWKSASSNALYRYVGTETGIFYTQPASVYVAEFDNTLRPWYKRAKLSTGLALSAPYIDAATNLAVVTLSKSLRHSQLDFFGVAGMDFELLQMRNIFESVVSCPSQSRCFLMDDAGYLILSPDGRAGDAALIRRTFVGSYSATLSQFANALLTSGNMIKRQCLDFSLLERQSFYDVVIPTSASGTSTCGSGVTYTVMVVPGTAFYLVVLSNLNDGATQCCPSTCSVASSSNQCEWPCNVMLSLLNRCRSFTPTTAESVYLACAPRTPALRANVPPASGLSTGAIVGIAIGSAAAALLLIVIIILIVRHGRHGAHGAAASAASAVPMDISIAASAPPLNQLQ